MFTMLHILRTCTLLWIRVGFHGVNAVHLTNDTILDINDVINGNIFSQVSKNGILSGLRSEANIIVWSPMKNVPNMTFICPLHGLSLQPAHWLKGNNPGCRPRLLYHVTGTVLLIAQYYYCPGEKGMSAGHRILSTDPHIIKQGGDRITRLFQLHHRTGWTRDLERWVVVHASSGYSFTAINEILQQLQVEYSGAPSDESISCPSADLIELIFLETVSKCMHIYDACMKNIDAKVLSFDHTFKISKNIGFKRSCDGKWITQFGCAFIAMNENGEVMSWKLTRSEGFSEIRQILIELRNRLAERGVVLDRIMVDNCCKLRGNIQQIFGPINVQLDLFHAIQRITKTIPKAKSTGARCVKDIKYIFRQLHDMGDYRTNSTPSPDVIKENIDIFRSKWHELFTDDTEKQIENLQIHITKGCLSYIPPSCGTNRNENLHGLLNRTLITSSRTIGPELATALLALMFYKVNKKRSGNSIFSLLPEDTEKTTPQNGKHALEQCAGSNNADLAVQPHVENDGDIAAALLSHSESMVTSLTGTHKSLQVRILEKLPFQSPFQMPSIQAGVGPNVLRTNLSKFNLVVAPISKDGDCAFASIIHCLHRLVGDNNLKDFETHLSSLKLDIHDSNLAILRLRSLFVDHVLHHTNLERFRSNCNNLNRASFISDVEKFRCSGIFACQIGDLIMPALAEILLCPIFIVTSIPAMELITFYPTSTSLVTEPLYIAYTQEGPGHYDSTLPARTEPESDASKVKDKPSIPIKERACYCRCGVNSKDIGRKFCSNTDNQAYSTRCKCFQMGKTCSELCKCANCGNGKEAMSANLTEAATITGRVRAKHSNYEKINSEAFLRENDITINDGSWTTNETCLLYSVVTYFNRCKITRKISREAVRNLFNAAVITAESKSLRQKSTAQITAKLAYHNYKEF